MTTLQDKTPEELNVICAELLGFVRSTTHKFSLYGLCEIDQEATDPVPAFTKDGRWYRANTLPPYATSYDAIMPEVKKLDDPTLVVLYRKLYWMLIPEEDQCEYHFITFPMVATMATASPADLTRALILVLQNK